MSRFGQVDCLQELDGKNVHRLENVLTMDIILRGLFDRLYLWLDPTVRLWLRVVRLIPIRPF